jgi:hypothetical protein
VLRWLTRGRAVKRAKDIRDFGCVLGRAIVGAIAAFVVVVFVLAFCDYLPSAGERSVSEAHRRQIGLRILACSVVAGAIAGVVLGKRRVSEFWLWLAVVFGVVCAIPVLPSKSGLLPFGTPYVNGPFSREKVCLLAIHLGIAALIALPIHILRKRKKQSPGL